MKLGFFLFFFFVLPETRKMLPTVNVLGHRQLGFCGRDLQGFFVIRVQANSKADAKFSGGHC